MIQTTTDEFWKRHYVIVLGKVMDLCLKVRCSHAHEKWVGIISDQSVLNENLEGKAGPLFNWEQSSIGLWLSVQAIVAGK
jgi:hypothetical protein